MIRKIVDCKITHDQYIKQRTVEKELLYLLFFYLLLLFVRMALTKTITYLFLAWNLFLAYLPYLFAQIFRYFQFNYKSKFISASIFLLWLFFVPNAFYILTDLFHLELSNDGIAKWFDLALIFSFAWTGLLLGIISLYNMTQILEKKVSAKAQWVLLYTIMFLNALGIYIGRFLRFNSWDILTNPFKLAGEIFYLCIHPFRNFYEWAMIACFAILMTLVYKSIISVGYIFWGGALQKSK